MNSLQRFFFNQILAWLQTTIKNPKSLDKELKIVAEVNDASAKILVMNGIKPSEGV